MALEGALRLHGEARQGLDTVSRDIANCAQLVSIDFLAAQCGTGSGGEHTGCVSKLVLLPFYPVLEGLGIAPCDLNLLLDRFLIHIGHITLWLRLWVVAVARARGGEASNPGASAGDAAVRTPSNGARQWAGGRTMATETRKAGAIACAE
jgi:hypothetical protein